MRVAAKGCCLFCSVALLPEHPWLPTRPLQGVNGTGTRGQDKIKQLRDNSNFFRRGLLALGFNVLGDWDSPVMVRGWHFLSFWTCSACCPCFYCP